MVCAYTLRSLTTMDSKRSPKVSGSWTRSSGPAFRKYAAIAGSVRWRVSEVRIAVFERSCGVHAGRSSVRQMFRRAPRYLWTVLMPIPILPSLSMSLLMLSTDIGEAEPLDRDRSIRRRFLSLCVPLRVLSVSGPVSKSWSTMDLQYPSTLL